jgi:hypothetical protein
VAKMSTFKGLEARFQPTSKSDQTLSTYQWSVIRWMPDRVSREQLSIGVILESTDLFHFRVIDDFSRLECAYGSEIVDFTKNTISLIEDLLKYRVYTSISDQIIFEKKGIARGSNHLSIINELFDKAVPLGKPHNQALSQYTHRFNTVRTSNFINDVQSYILKKAPSNYEKIFPSDPQVRIIHEENHHTLNIPIRFGSKAASMVSTVYSTQDKLENHCLKAMNDLEIALRTNTFQDSALAILTAEKNQLSCLEKYEISRREDFLDDFIWKLRLKGIKSFSHTKSDASSEALLKWIDAPIIDQPQTPIELIPSFQLIDL